ncbi:PRC-barrel domain-containing protein [Nocardia sp. NPDC006630]|uniref:PRC-barrel domain-containing protein n=1 Tax=Nocardia sp. NPDC006630 TaxID=3157181 RepID=UPI0033BD63E9
MAKTTLDSLIGCTMYDTAGEQIGRVENFYVDDDSGEPTWAVVSTGMFGEHSLVPLMGAEYRAADTTLRVPAMKSQVDSAPHLDHDGRIEPRAEQELLAHYGADRRRAGADPAGRGRIQPGPDAPMTTGRSDPNAVLREQERLMRGHEQEVSDTVRTDRFGTGMPGTGANS